MNAPAENIATEEIEVSPSSSAEALNDDEKKRRSRGFGFKG